MPAFALAHLWGNNEFTVTPHSAPLFMSSHSLRRTYRLVAQRLSFPLDDVPRVVELFGKWRREGEAKDKELLDIWMYAYLCRYVATKLLKGEVTSPMADVLVVEIYEKAQRHLQQVEDPARFVNWLSVVCKHTWLGHLRKDTRYVSLTEAHVSTIDQDPFEIEEKVFLLHAVHEAIEHLPPYLIPAARMRLLEDKPYKEIEALTGTSEATLRAYVQRTLQRLKVLTAG